MKTHLQFTFYVLLMILITASCQEKPSYPLTTHPDAQSWQSLFAEDLSNAIYPDSVWSLVDGEFTVTEDQFLWTEKEFLLL